MAEGHTVILISDASRDLACSYALKAPAGYVAEFYPPKRSDEQNRKMWAMLSDVSRAKPEGRTMTPDLWKAVFMQACGHEVQFLMGLDGMPFPHGFRSSKLSVAQMADLITFIQAYGDQQGVPWSDREPATNQGQSHDHP